MSTLLVMTVGQTDVQLVKDGKKCEFAKEKIYDIHSEIERRFSDMEFVPTPDEKGTRLDTLPPGKFKLCTPKLDAILKANEFREGLPTAALILETTRTRKEEPHFAGAVLERRLRDRGVADVTRSAFLSGDEWLGEPSNEIDAVIRREVVARLSKAIAQATAKLTQNDSVVVATTGGIPPANEVIKELVRLHTVGGPKVTVLEVPEQLRGETAESAVQEKFHPAAAIQARWHALSLIEKGNLLAAWGAVKHLEEQPGQDWIKVIHWLKCFASSLPMPENCDIPVLKDKRMAVRVALRVELALRAGDIPKAVHGTVAFFESALWDHLFTKGIKRHPNYPKDKLYSFPEGAPCVLLRECFKPKKNKENEKELNWYSIDDRMDCAIRIANEYLKCPALTELGKAVGKIYDLRNDVAHNEPTAELMENARHRMQSAKLWSEDDRFLGQPLVQKVLKELKVENPATLCDDLIEAVRTQLRGVSTLPPAASAQPS